MLSELGQFVQAAKAQGGSDVEITQALKNAGWDENQIKQAFAENSSQSSGTVNQVGVTFKSHGGWLIKSKLILVLVFFLVAAGVAYGGFYLYTKRSELSVKLPIFNTENKGLGYWNAYLRSEQPKISKERVSVIYQDRGQLPDSEKLLGFVLIDPKVSANIQGYFDSSNASSTKVSANISYTFGSGNTQVTSGLEIRGLGEDSYVRIGGNPLLESLAKPFNPQNKEWVKLPHVNPGTTSSSPANEEIDKLWSFEQIATSTFISDDEVINNINVAHFRVTFLKDIFKEKLLKSIEILAEDSKSGVNRENVTLVKQFLGEIADKIVISNWEVWVGKKDAYLYKYKLESNAPSFVATLKNLQNLLPKSITAESLLSPIAQAFRQITPMKGLAPQVLGLQTTEFDLIRLQDMANLGKALKAYKAENGGYPEALAGKPDGLAPKYIESIPVSAKPNGRCMDFYNTYWYTPKGTMKVNSKGVTVYPDYQYTFCLGADVGNVKSGIGIMTPDGITTTLSCTNLKQDPCLLPESQEKDAKTDAERMDDLLRAIDFSALFKIDGEVQSYNQVENVVPPSTWLDLEPILNDPKTHGLNI